MNIGVNSDDITFRELQIADAELLYHWKNDPETRANSRNTEEVPWESHFRWVSSVIENPGGKILRLAVLNSMPVGLVRTGFHEDGRTEVHYTVSPVFRKRGIGTAMVKRFVSENVLDIMKIVLPIKSGNIGSEKIASSLGLCKLISAPIITEEGQPPLFEWLFPSSGDA